MALLDIKNLTLEIDTENGWIKALDKANLTVKEGEIQALVGEQYVPVSSSNKFKSLFADILISPFNSPTLTSGTITSV